LRADEAYDAEQRAQEAQQQALAGQDAKRERLQAENDALRRQNDEYQEQLTQPTYNDPVYWGRCTVSVSPSPPRHRSPHAIGIRQTDISPVQATGRRPDPVSNGSPNVFLPQG
jgi:hypothetical protein